MRGLTSSLGKTKGWPRILTVSVTKIEAGKTREDKGIAKESQVFVARTCERQRSYQRMTKG